MRRVSLLRLPWFSLVLGLALWSALALPTEYGGVYAQGLPAADDDHDGIPNATDCAPLDDRLAVPQVFYVDADLDQYGNATQPVSLCTLAPPPPLVAWGNDIDDTSNRLVPPIVPQGQRVLAIDIGPGAEIQSWQPEIVRELGVEATTLHLHWHLLETAPYTYAGPQIDTLRLAQALFSAENLQLSLTVSPIVRHVLAVPADLRAGLESGRRRFSDPQVIERFKRLLTYMHQQLPQVTLASLQIGHEVDQYILQKPRSSMWSDFFIFYQAVGAHAKTLWGKRLKVGVTATHTGLVTEPTQTIMRMLNARSDLVSATYLPRHADFTVIAPTQVRTDLEKVMALYAPKAVYIQAVGFPSAVRTGSSQTTQSQFIKAFFDVWDHYAAWMPFVSFVRLHDLSPAMARIDLLNFTPTSTPTALSYVESLGLRTYTGTGQAKAAYKTLRNLAFERGWWRIRQPTARTFYMGFTPRPYDTPPDAATQQQVETWMQSHLTAHADIVALHFDSGIPWVEAFQDTFSTLDPPYSQNVLETWRSERATRPPNARLFVSINPLGVPRRLLAPYWGYGEGYFYDIDNDFARVPNGIFADAADRLPPPPWNTYDFDAEPVKIAFLKYCIRVIEFFQPDYLAVAIEASAVLDEAPERYAKYLALQQFVYTALKGMAQYRHVPLIVSVSATSFMADEYGIAFKEDEMPLGKRQRQLQGLRDLVPYVDILGLSFYPHYGKYNASQLPASIFDDMLALIEESGKPFAVTESGYIAETLDIVGFPFTSSATKQNRYLKWLLYEMEKSTSPAEFLINFHLRDNDYSWERLRDNAPPGALFIEFYKYFRDIGIFDGDGKPRPSARTWRITRALPLKRPVRPR